MFHGAGKGLLLALSIFCPGVNGFGEAQKYLFVAAPETGQVAYLKLPSPGGPAVFDGEPMRVLIGSGLQYPQGVAVDSHRKQLYVADPGLGQLVRFPLQDLRGDAVGVGSMETVASGVEVRAVAVDGLGNVFFTDEPTQRILKVTASMIEAGNTTAEVVYDGGAVKAVSAPGGIALDNFFVYWLNKASGTQVGTLVRGVHTPPGGANSTDGLVVLANNALKCYGLCLALGNIFYTDEANNLYGIQRSSTASHNPVTITSTLQEPRGCAYDGDSTVYVADKAQNAVFQFAANMNAVLPNRRLTKAADLQGAFGVAVYVRL